MSAYLKDAFRPLKLLENYYMTIEEIVTITFGPYREQMESLNMSRYVPVTQTWVDIGKLVTNIGSWRG